MYRSYGTINEDMWKERHIDYANAKELQDQYLELQYYRSCLAKPETEPKLFKYNRYEYNDYENNCKGNSLLRFNNYMKNRYEDACYEELTEDDLFDYGIDYLK